jgi:hypothetical protein
LKFQNVNHIRVLNCDIEWMGGAEVDGQPQQRYGNGIEFYGTAYYCQAIGNYIYEMYDSGIDYQAVNGLVAGVDLLFANNIIVSTGLAGIELWSRPSNGKISNVNFTGNSISDIGGSWGGVTDQRKPGTYWGLGIMLDYTQASISKVSFTNNTLIEPIYSTTSPIFAVSSDYDYGALEIDNNLYEGSGSALLYVKYLVTGGSLTIIQQFTLNQWVDYQSYTGKDAHSLINLI